jgi:hypothetical protein
MAGGSIFVPFHPGSLELLDETAALTDLEPLGIL